MKALMLHAAAPGANSDRANGRCRGCKRVRWVCAIVCISKECNRALSCALHFPTCSAVQAADPITLAQPLHSHTALCGGTLQAAVASVLGQPVANVGRLSVQDLYYCGEERTSCLTGAALKATLAQLEKRQLVLEDCLPYQQPNLRDAAMQDVLCAKSCQNTSPLASKGSFTYVPISQVWQAQQHIRRFGAVVSKPVRVLVKVCVYVSVCVCARAHTCVHAYACECVLVYIHAHSHAHARMHAHTRTHTNVRTDTHIHTRKTHNCVRACACTYVTLSMSCSGTPTRTHLTRVPSCLHGCMQCQTVSSLAHLPRGPCFLHCRQHDLTFTGTTPFFAGL
jgi:hypothetical protein